MRNVTFNPSVGAQFLRYAQMVAARGYVHNTLGNIAVRVDAPGFRYGVAYTKQAEASLEEMEMSNIVITDVPTSEILYGDAMTSVGHNLN